MKYSATVWIWKVTQRSMLKELVFSLELLGDLLPREVYWEIFRLLGGECVLQGDSEIKSQLLPLLLFHFQSTRWMFFYADQLCHDALLGHRSLKMGPINHGLEPEPMNQNKYD